LPRRPSSAEGNARIEAKQKSIAKAVPPAKIKRNTENTMKLEGGCYCGAVRYVAEGEPMMKAQCHCRECQYITGGSPNMFLLMPPAGFSYTKGTPKQFTRSDLESAVTREFCAECGTHMVTRRPGLPAVILKAGTLDDPALFGTPQMAIYTVDKQAFHQIPEGLPSFERLPQRR
jgi:hypothetical protein